LLRTGERAVTISVDQIMSNDGMLIYGDRVDLMLLMEKDAQGTSEQNPDSLLPLLQNVRVLSVGKRALVTRDADLSNDQQNPDLDPTYSTLTVGVSADDAARLLLARDLGSITVMLRNRSDNSPFDSKLLGRDSLFSSNPDADTFEFYAGSQVDNGKLKLSVQSIDGQVSVETSAVDATPPASAETSAPVEPAKPGTGAP
jgi:pilus assembly protein CpaB